MGAPSASTRLRIAAAVEAPGRRRPSRSRTPTRRDRPRSPRWRRLPSRRGSGPGPRRPRSRWSPLPVGAPVAIAVRDVARVAPRAVPEVRPAAGAAAPGGFRPPLARLRRKPPRAGTIANGGPSGAPPRRRRRPRKRNSGSVSPPRAARSGRAAKSWRDYEIRRRVRGVGRLDPFTYRSPSRPAGNGHGPRRSSACRCSGQVAGPGRSRLSNSTA